MNELKPCPFCGGKPFVYGELTGRFIVGCPECKYQLPYVEDGRPFAFDGEEEAIEAWNTRKEEKVRCCDCVYAGEQGLNGCQRWWSDYIGGYPRLKIPKVDPNGFCAWGKRRCE